MSEKSKITIIWEMDTPEGRGIHMFEAHGNPVAINAVSHGAKSYLKNHQGDENETISFFGIEIAKNIQITLDSFALGEPEAPLGILGAEQSDLGAGADENRAPAPKTPASSARSAPDDNPKTEE